MKRTIKNNNNFYLENEHRGLTTVDFQEIKPVQDTENGSVRMYRHYIGSDKNPDSFTLQFRQLTSLSKTSKPKNLIASVSISLDDLKWLYEQAQLISDDFHIRGEYR